MAIKRTNDYLKTLNNPKMSEKERVALSLNETYGKLMTNGGMAVDGELDKIVKTQTYEYAKMFMQNHYRDLDNSIVLELAVMLALNKELHVKFVPSKSYFVDVELDYVPTDEKNKDVYTLLKFGEKGEKLFEKNYNKEESEIVKAERNSKKEDVQYNNSRERV